MKVHVTNPASATEIRKTLGISNTDMDIVKKEIDKMITNPRFTANPLCELNLTEKQILNSLFQQVMSKFRPNRFSLFKELDTFIPRTQLEKLVIANLKKHKTEVIQTISKSSKPMASNRKVSDANRYLTEEK